MSAMRLSLLYIVSAVGCLLLVATGCQQQTPVEEVQSHSPKSDSVSETSVDTDTEKAEPETVTKRRRRKLKYLKTLSEYQLFQGELVDHRPAEGVVPYDLNTPLFSDYAAKLRFVKMPAGESVPYNSDESFDFPLGTVIAKTFGHDNDMTDRSKGRQLIETRILVREENGWIGLPYVWNDQQTEATLSITGASVEVEWIHTDGRQRKISHLVPNMNDCKRCHVENVPIGPKARHLNGDFVYEHGKENQLAFWSRSGILTGAPAPEEAPRLAVWNDESTGSLDDRARAWLEINCAHCHSETGPARNSGLHLFASVTDPFKLGIFKGPVAAGRGTGGRRYDIVPGKPDESILMYRMETTHPGEVMPEFGRSVVDQEANELIRQWIANMKDVQATVLVAQVEDERQSASVALSRGDRNGAIEAVEAMLLQSPDDPRTIMIAADVYLRCGKPDLAVPLYDRYVEARPDSLPQLWQRGIALYFIGKQKEAAQQFVIHRQANPHDVENAAWHFLCVAKADSFAKATQSVLPAPDDSRVPMSEVQQMLASGNTDAVIERMGQVPKESRQYASAIFYGNFYLGLYADAGGDQETALKRMTAAANDAPHHYMGDIARVYASHLRESAGRVETPQD